MVHSSKAIIQKGGFVISIWFIGIESKSLAPPKPSSRYIIIFKPWFHQYLTTSFNNLVNICPALAIPKGSTLNTKYLDLPLYTHEQYLLF
jgi:hypothetical protein